MDIDVAALRALERERDISLDVLIPAIEQALLVAYHRTDGSYRIARVELERKTGHVIVWAREEGELLPSSDGERQERADPGPEFDDTPDGFGRVAAATARQVIVQRLRDLEDEQILGDFRGREGDVVSGVIQQSSDPRTVLVDFGTVEGVLPLAEQVPGERYRHGDRLRCYVVSVKRGPRGPQIGLSRTHRTSSAPCSASRSRRSPTGPSRSRPWPGRPATARRSPSTRRSLGSTPRAPASGRWAPGYAR